VSYIHRWTPTGLLRTHLSNVKTSFSSQAGSFHTSAQIWRLRLQEGRVCDSSLPGEGRSMKPCRELAGGEATFLGRVSHDQLLNLHRRARALLMPGIGGLRDRARSNRWRQGRR